jgi:hypothetical protein
MRMRKEQGDTRKEGTYDHCCCHTQLPPQSLHTCTSHTRNPRKRRQSDFAAVADSFLIWGRMQDFDRGSAGGWFASMRA